MHSWRPKNPPWDEDQPDGESNLSLPTDNAALGLEVLVEGENAIVEYVLRAAGKGTTLLND